MFTMFMMAMFILLIICFVYCCYKSYQKETYQGKLLGRTFIAVNIVFLAFSMNFLSDSKTIMSVMCSLEHAAMSFTLYFFTIFIVNFVGAKELKAAKYISLGVTGLDALILITNPINHLAFYPEYRSGNGAMMAVASSSSIFTVHLAICGIFLIMECICLVRKAFEVPVYYHLRYAYMILIIAAVIVANMIYNHNKAMLFDYSKLLYAIGVILVYNVTYAFSPKTLLKRLRQYISDNITDPVIIYDTAGKLLDINKGARSIIDYEDYCKQDRITAFFKHDEEGIFRREYGNVFYEIRHEKFFDKRGKFLATGFFMHDVTENEKQVEREHEAVILDPLTNSYNRLGFFERAECFLSENQADANYAIIISGICNFKGMNGLYGTKIGDEILRSIADKLHDAHHIYPMIYGRTAEGKFSCLVHYSYVQNVIGMLNDISINLGGDATIFVDLCYGYVQLNQNNVKFEDYYEMALMALSNCKKMPKVAIEYNQSMADDILKQQLLLAEVHDEVDGHQFYIELQPQIDIRNNRVCGAEALVRWEHPTLGKVGPNDFIPLFESNGFITKLDHFVWEQAASTIARLSDAGLYDGHISVNVSQKDIKNTDVASDLEKIIRKYGIPAAKLHVEITESACADDRKLLIATMNKLREKGFPVEIDDFGSGYSSLNALMKLPFDIVKLDMIFMKEYVDGEKSDVVISSIAKMIHDLNATIVVEGIETTKNLEIANDIQADVAQGYYFSKPLSIAKFVEFVSENR